MIQKLTKNAEESFRREWLGPYTQKVLKELNSVNKRKQKEKELFDSYPLVRRYTSDRIEAAFKIIWSVF